MEQREKGAYTIEDIARELGVSKTTVSRAISGKGRISPETRAKVQDFIARHNYRPNAVAKSLAKNRTYNLGLILPGDGSVDFAFFQECMSGICETASRYDYDVLITMDNGACTDQIRRIIDNHKVDGMITARSEADSPVLSLLKERKVPFVAIGSGADSGVLHLDNDNRGGCRELSARLISRGIRRMALLGGDERFDVTHSRFQGFEDACRQGGLAWEEQLVFMNVDNSARAAAAIDEIAGRQADCIVCMDDFICNLAMIQLKAKGISVPRDVRLACFYDDILLEHMAPPVTSLRFNASELGRAACRELLNLLEGRPAQSRVLPGYQIIFRASTD